MPLVDEAIARVPGLVGFFAEDLTTGEHFSHNADKTFFTASTFKVPLLVGLFTQVESGNIGLSERFKLKEDMKVAGSGVLKEMDPGIELTIHDLAMLMIIVSDNTATDIIYDLVGKDNLREILAPLGLTNTRIPMTCRELLCSIVGLNPQDNSLSWIKVQEKLRNQEWVFDSKGFNEETSDVSSPRDMANLLKFIERREVVSTKACEQMLNILKRQQLREMLPKKLPTKEVHVAHKTGGYFRVQCDVGIVYTSKSSYSVAIMAKKITDMRGIQDAVADLSEAIYFSFSK
ncbi:serine hydrolase [SAR202 cluster bacterium AC-409-J13_OGT_754m]|nr:serine hydrolase [SAR202 cluster bacterium AC-409-J13_OGT_754m]